MKELTTIEQNQENIDIEDMIYEIRGKQVMLDSDLAKLYKCKNGTKEINQAVKNNLNKFPERFSWILTNEEYSNLRSKFLTSSVNGNYGGRRYNPRVFTEQGVAMLATVLKSKIATEISIAIMDAFVKMRKYISTNLNNQEHINNLVLEHNTTLLEHSNEIKLIQKTLDKFEEKESINEIYFDGQIYDAYSKIKDIMFEAKKELVIIDSYADKTILYMIKNVNSKVILITSNKSKLTNLDISKYNKQYNNLKIIYSNNFHDRYFIIDRNKTYHCGTSINYAGCKTFSINILEDNVVKQSLINEVVNII